MSSKPETAGQTPPVARVVAEALVDRERRNPFLRYFLHLGLPVTISVVLHVGVIVFLALKTFEVASRPAIEVGEYEASLVESLADQMADAFQWTDPAALEAPVAAPLDETFATLAQLPDITDVDFGRLDADDLGAGRGDGSLGLGDGPLSLLGTGSGAGAAGSGGFGSGFGGGSGLGEVGVWNLSIRANKIVYVVDFSGSIITTQSDLKRELKRSVGRLKSSQSFNVIVFYQDFDRVKTEAFRPKLEPAVRQTRLEFFKWIGRKSPQGGTEPLPAIERALAMRPEAIFFFSDGEFDDEVVDAIKRANRRTHARIYCVVFDEFLLGDTSGLPGETPGARRLKRIADMNEGKTKVVTGVDLAQ